MIHKINKLARNAQIGQKSISNFDHQPASEYLIGIPKNLILHAITLSNAFVSIMSIFLCLLIHLG
jgi:hypothetical protein